jgi:hypothetical protein
MPTPELFIAIPSYQDSQALQNTAQFIRERTTNTFVLDLEIAKLDVVKNKNALLLRARDSGAKYIAFGDDDVEPQLGWDKLLIDGMNHVQTTTGRKIGQTGPRFLFPDGKVFALWMDVYFDPQQKEHIILPAYFGGDDLPFIQTSIFVGALPGTLSIFRREVLEEMNWRFDDRYVKSQDDDVDQSLECRTRGYSAFYNGNVSVIHHTKKVSPRASEENRRKLIEKWGSRFDLSLVIPPSAEAMAAAARQLTGTKSPLSVRLKGAKGILAGLTQNPQARLSKGLRTLRMHGIKGVIEEFRRRYYRSL